jgi:hypothetical protein
MGGNTLDYSLLDTPEYTKRQRRYNDIEEVKQFIYQLVANDIVGDFYIKDTMDTLNNLQRGYVND